MTKSSFHTRDDKHTPPSVKRVEVQESSPGMNTGHSAACYSMNLSPSPLLFGTVGGFQINLGVQTGWGGGGVHFFFSSI